MMEHKVLATRADAYTPLHTATPDTISDRHRKSRPSSVATSVTRLSRCARAPDILPGPSTSLTTNTKGLLPDVPPITTPTPTDRPTPAHSGSSASSTSQSTAQEHDSPRQADTTPQSNAPQYDSPRQAGLPVLTHNPPQGCVTTFRKGFTLNSPEFSNEFTNGLYLNLYRSTLYVVGRGLAGYITDDYELKFHRLPGPKQLLSRPFSLCNNNTLVFSDRRTWHVCSRKSGRFLSLFPPQGQDCHPITLHAKWDKQSQEALIAPLRSVSPARPKQKPQDSSSIDKAAIAGIVVAGAVVITILIVSVIFFKQKKDLKWNWKRIFARRPRLRPDLESPVYEKDSVQQPAEVSNRPPTDMIDSTPLAELPGVRTMAELPTEFNEKVKLKKLIV